MVDKNPSPRSEDPEPTRHECDNPNIGATDFLLAVMHDRQLPLATRIDAAAKLLRIYPDEWFTPRVTIRIPDQHDTLSTGPGPIATDGRLGIGRHFLPRENKARTRSDDNSDAITLRENTDTYTPDYSVPPTAQEIEEIKAAVHALRPDYDPSQPVTLHLCACGHWLTFPCDCATRTRH